MTVLVHPAPPPPLLQPTHVITTKVFCRPHLSGTVACVLQFWEGDRKKRKEKKNLAGENTHTPLQCRTQMRRDHLHLSQATDTEQKNTKWGGPQGRSSRATLTTLTLASLFWAYLYRRKLQGEKNESKFATCCRLGGIHVNIPQRAHTILFAKSL